MIDDTELRKCKARALRILGSRSLSAGEVEKRLVEKGESAQTAKEVVKWLEDAGYVNDAEYAESVVRHYCAKGYGLARIRDELYRRGIERDIWDDALSAAEETEPGGAAQGFLAKKLRGSTDKDDLRRAAEALGRRGFSYEEAREAIKSYIESVER